MRRVGKRSVPTLSSHGPGRLGTAPSRLCPPYKAEERMYLEKHRLDGRVALVTGGGRGIGLACSHALAEAGAKVVIADVDQAVAREGKESLAGASFEAETVDLDVTDSAAVRSVADELNSRLGSVDVLVNNAGIARSGTAAEDV